MKRLMKRLSALAVVGALLGTGLVAGVVAPASATEAAGSSPSNPIIVSAKVDAPEGTVWTAGEVNTTTCTVTDTGINTVPGQTHQGSSHEEARYSQVIPGKDSTSHKEYRFQTRAKLYGSKEVKDITGYDFVSGGTTRVNGQTVAGHWVQSAGVHTIPDVIINIVWGSGGVPASVLGEGTVNLSVYGGPSVNVHYNAHKVTTDAGYTDWGPWSDWSTDNPGGSNDLRNVESKSVSDNNGVADKTVYYLPGGGQSDTLTDANWTTETPGSPWVQVDTRTVKDSNTTKDDDVVTYYAYTHKAEGCTPPPTVGECVSNGSVHTTDLSTWNLTETRANGHNELIDGGLHVWTDDSSSLAKAAGYYPADFDLKDVGTFNINWSGSTPPPGGQLLVDLDNDGQTDGYLVVEEAYGTDGAWLSSNWHGIDLSAAPTSFNGGGTGKGGTFNQWLVAFPNAHVSAIGYSLGSGVKGDGVITSITAGCTVYTFDRPAQPEPLTGTDTRTTDVCVEDNSGNATTTVYGTDWTQAYVWNGKSWVLGEKVYGDEHVVSTSVAPSQDCSPERADEVTVTESKPVCGSDTVDVTTTTTTYSYEFVEGKWNEQVASSQVVTQRPLTVQEQVDLICATPNKHTLAITGGGIAWGAAGVGAAALIGGILFLVFRRRNREA